MRHWTWSSTWKHAIVSQGTQLFKSRACFLYKGREWDEATPLFLIPSPNNCRAQHSRVSVGRGVSEIASHSHWCWTEDSKPSIKSRVKVIIDKNRPPLQGEVRGVFQEVETVCIHRFHLPLPRQQLTDQEQEWWSESQESASNHVKMLL